MRTLIEGGTVVDGTGGPARPADVCIDGDRIASIGTDLAKRFAPDVVIDAHGQIVAPGFIDLHTHYDAQLFWDPDASPSPLHGVTTVLGGNCGFSLAPCGPEDVDYLSRMMARVEGMPLAALRAGLTWDWTSFGDWLGRLDGNLGVNAGFLVGHSTLRRLVMGSRAVGTAATENDLVAMEAALDAALSDGALGWSTSQVHTHNDGDGQPVPSRAASWAELERLARVVSHHPGTTVELIVAGCLNGFSDEDIDLLSAISMLADRPVNWNVLGVSAANPEGVWSQLAASTEAAERGATLVALTLPHTMQIRLSFEHGAILDGLPGWRELFALAPAQRMAALSDPTTRKALDEGAQSEAAGILRHLAVWSRLVVEETFAEENAGLEGQSVGAIAKRRGVSPFDALADIVVADELRTGLRPPIPESEEDWALRAQVWADPRAIVGGSDAGAHLDTMCGAIYSTALLGDGVRKRSLLSWTAAIRQLTDIPARLYGLRDRGRLVAGAYADVVVFDPTTIGHGAVRTKDDLPGGASRLYAEAEGITHVLVNGVEIVRDGRFSGARPGTCLRAGIDTDTVHAGADWINAER